MMNSVLRPPRFVPYSEYRTVRIYERDLPHWRQDGGTYFVTFRLADSIPDGVRRQGVEEKKQWLERRGIAYDRERGHWREALHRLPQQEQFRFEKHFNRRVQSCLDRGLGECHLQELECITALRATLFRNDGCRHHLGDFVIMPNHVHLLITPVAEEEEVERNSFRSSSGKPTELERILKSIKGASAVACNRLRRRTGAFWQADSYDHIVRSLEPLSAYRECIARNPVLAHLELPPQAISRADWIDAWLHES